MHILTRNFQSPSPATTMPSSIMAIKPRNVRAGWWLFFSGIRLLAGYAPPLFGVSVKFKFMLNDRRSPLV